ncbi:MAG: universal stress protein [Bacteroidota bacterium]
MLVPLDFTDASKNAFEYALQLAKELGAELHMLHVVSPAPILTSYPPELMVVPAFDTTVGVKEQLKKLTTYYPNKDKDVLIEHNVPLQYWVKEGPAVTTILATAEALSVDMILLGAKARTQIGNFLLGSVTADLITQTELPVLVIPANCAYEPIEHIAYSTEMEGKDQAAFQQLKLLANQLLARLQPFFVNQLTADVSNDIEETWTTASLSPKEGEIEDVAVVRQPFVTVGIHYFLEQHPSQILAMFTPKRSFLAQLFHLSVTQQMVAQTTIPLLIYRG